MDKTIYNLELHERIEWDNINIVRVPGGWVYSVIYEMRHNVGLNKTAVQGFIGSVFVPYNEEFKGREHEEERVKTEIN